MKRLRTRRHKFFIYLASTYLLYSLFYSFFMHKCVIILGHSYIPKAITGQTTSLQPKDCHEINIATTILFIFYVIAILVSLYKLYKTKVYKT